MNEEMNNISFVEGVEGGNGWKNGMDIRSGMREQEEEKDEVEDRVAWEEGDSG